MAKKKAEAAEPQHTESANTATAAMMIPYGKIVVDEDVNVRKTYDTKRIASLADSIRKQGQLDPFLVEQAKDGTYRLISGFRRARAYKVLYPDAAVLAEVMVPVNVKTFTSADEIMLANLAFDEAREPVKRYELADRLAYMHKELGWKGIDLAKQINMSNATVSQLISCRTKLIEPIIEAWSSAPGPEHEIPVSRLYEWSQATPEEQQEAFEAYMASSLDEDPEDDGKDPEGGDGEPDDKKRKRTLLLKPRSKKELVTKLEEFREREKAQEEFSDIEVGAYRALRWALQEMKSLRLS